MREGACVRCGWDSSISEYIFHIKFHGDTNRDPSVPTQNPTPSIADLFDPEPEQWGLRGDRYLWREMKKMFSNAPLPHTAAEFRDAILDAFQDLVGVRIDDGQDMCFVERYAHGGMSSGHVSLQFWSSSALSILGLRYANAQGRVMLAKWRDTDGEQSGACESPS